jgi:hypothetical protein
MRICSGAGCLRAVPDRARFCDECLEETRLKPQGEKDGSTLHANGYNALLDALNKQKRWQELRLRVLKKYPICNRCDRRLSEICDHVVPAQIAVVQAQESRHYPFDQYAGYFLFSNLQGLCRPCHGLKTLEDKAHVGPWPDVVAIEVAAPKRKWTF